MQVLVTGGQGFLGAWIIRRLYAAGHIPVVFDASPRTELVQRIAGQVPRWILGDIADAQAVADAAAGCAAIIHLAGILTPDCARDPIRGAIINLIGTLAVFEAARRHGIRHLVYTSSAGVYGPAPDADPWPITHYGTFKLACEGSARAYWHDHGIASIGLRPQIVYGPGRETGLTAGPSLACQAAAQGEAYTIGYTGPSGLVFVDDVAAAYVAAMLHAPDGSHVFNLPGEVATTAEVVAAIHRLIPGARIDTAGPPLDLPPRMPMDNLAEILLGLPRTSLADGLARTIAFYGNGVV
jgi:nucleoside-diphosphate-sugar epimerase